jgi:homeodomain-containing protein
MLNSTTVSARVVTRARIVLWRAEGWMKKDIALRSVVSRPTVDAVLKRFAAERVAGLLDKPVTVVQPDRVPAEVRARIVAVTRCSPPRETGLSHWSSRELSVFLKRTTNPDPEVVRFHTRVGELASDVGEAELARRHPTMRSPRLR